MRERMIVGIDIGARCGISTIYVGGPRVEVLASESFKSDAFTRRLELAVVDTLWQNRSCPAIEFVYERAVGRPHTIRGTAKQAGRWLEALDLAGFGDRVTEVNVSSWRKQLFGRAPRSEEAKALACAKVRELFGIDTNDSEIAESICVALWKLKGYRDDPTTAT